MPVIRFKYSNSDGSPAGTHIIAQPTARHVRGDRVVTATPIIIDLNESGEASENLAPTESDWAWMIVEKLNTPRASITYVNIPDVTGPLEFADLDRVDPDTMRSDGLHKGPRPPATSMLWLFVDYTYDPDSGDPLPTYQAPNGTITHGDLVDWEA